MQAEERYGQEGYKYVGNATYVSQIPQAFSQMIDVSVVSAHLPVGLCPFGYTGAYWLSASAEPTASHLTSSIGTPGIRLSCIIKPLSPHSQNYFIIQARSIHFNLS